MDEKRSSHEPSPEEYERIAKGFDVAAAGMISAAGVWLQRAKWAILMLIAALVLAYVGEDLWLRWSVRSGQQPFDTMTVLPYIAIHKKSGRVEYDAADPVNESCVKAAFPHFDVSPCWYLQRHLHPILDR